MVLCCGHVTQKLASSIPPEPLNAVRRFQRKEASPFVRLTPG